MAQTFHCAKVRFDEHKAKAMKSFSQRVVVVTGAASGIVRNSRVNQKTIGGPEDKLKTDFDTKARTTADQAAAIIIRGVLKNKRRILAGIDAKIMSLVTRLFLGTYEKVLGFEIAVRQRSNARLEKSAQLTDA